MQVFQLLFVAAELAQQTLVFVVEAVKLFDVAAALLELLDLVVGQFQQFLAVGGKMLRRCRFELCLELLQLDGSFGCPAFLFQQFSLRGLYGFGKGIGLLHTLFFITPGAAQLGQFDLDFGEIFL